MRTLSLWASRHVQASRLLLVVLHTAIVLLGLYSGVLLAVFGVALPGWLLPAVAVLAGLGFLAYPFSGQGRFRLRKWLDFGFVLASFTLLMTWSNQTPAPAIQPVRAVPIVERGLPQAERQISGVERVLKAPKVWVQKRLQKRAIQWGPLPGEYRPELVVASFIGIGLAIFLLGGLVALLACNLSCSGYEVLAVIVLFLGWGGLLVGGFFAGRAAVRKWGLRNRV
jgi:hypothetical protein